eukprot:g595.t1
MLRKFEIFVFSLSLTLVCSSKVKDFCSDEYKAPESIAGSLIQQAEEVEGKVTQKPEWDSWQGHRSDESESLKAVLIDGKSITDDYGQSLLTYGAPGIILFVISLLATPCVIVARCCCKHKCCKPRKDQDEYSKLDRWGPMIMYNIFALVCGLLAVLGMIEISKLSRGSTNALCEVDSLLTKTDKYAGDALPFLHKFSGLMHSDADEETFTEKDYSCETSFRHRVYSNLKDVQGLGVPINGLVKMYNATDFTPGTDVRKGLPDFVSGLKTEEQFCLADKNTPSIGSCVPVSADKINGARLASTKAGESFCRYISNEATCKTSMSDCSAGGATCVAGCSMNILEEIAAEKVAFEAALKAIVDDKTCGSGNDGVRSVSEVEWNTVSTVLLGQLDEIGENLSKEVDSLWSAIAGLHSHKFMSIAIKSVEELQSYTSASSSIRASLDEIKEKSLDATVLLEQYSWVLFITCFIAAFSGIFSILVWLTPCKWDDIVGGYILDFSWILSLIFLTFMFLLGGVGIPAAITYSDMCVVLDDFRLNMPEYMGKGKATPAVDSGRMLHLNVPEYFADEIVVDQSWENTYLRPGKKNSKREKGVRQLNEGVTKKQKLDVSISMVTSCLQTKGGSTKDNLYNAFYHQPEMQFEITAATPWLDKLGKGNNLDLVKSLSTSGASVHDMVDALICKNSPCGSQQWSGACSTVQTFKDSMKKTEDALTKIQVKLRPALKARDDLLQEIETMKKNTVGGCGFIHDAYEAIGDEMCSGALGALGQLVTYFFLLGVLGVFLVTFAICTSISVFGRGHKGNSIVPDAFVD